MKPRPPPLPPIQVLCMAALLLTCAVCAFSANRCPNCGSTPVPYPFSTGPTCGDPLYKIRCNAGALVFDSVNNSYPIISIEPSCRRLVIQPASLVPNACVTSDYIHQGIHLNGTLPFNITGDNTIMFLNCTESLLGSPLNCSSTSLCHVYINNTRPEYPCQDGSLCCTFRTGGSTTSYMIPLEEAGCRAYTSFVNLDPGLPVEKWPNPGLAIQWVPPQEPLCGTGSHVDCDGNSTCRPDPNVSGLSRCYCNRGLLWDPIQGICAPNATRAADSDELTDISLVIGLTLGIGSTVVIVFISILVYKHTTSSKEALERLTKEREKILNAGGNRGAKLFTGKEIKSATNFFSTDRLLGAGGYGEVYKGILDDGTSVAVKCAKVGNAKSTDQILNEVRILCQVNHRSLVHLLGCCVELERPILVYEYIQNGNLLHHLQGLNPCGQGQLSWIHRLRIALQTAEGLAYLHFSAVCPIYHRDVKSSNILLDENLNAKVSDFGLSRLGQRETSHISTCVQGTLGYLDPEYYKNFHLTDKSDVYSFGVVLMELLTAQKAIDFNRPEDDVNLAVYVQRMVQEEKLMDVIHPMLKENASNLEIETMKALAFLALSCLEEQRQNRPSMKEVAEEIEYIMSIAEEN